MPVVVCPACGEDEDLTGRREGGDADQALTM
jgi:hypothetical protein